MSLSSDFGFKLHGFKTMQFPRKKIIAEKKNEAVIVAGIPASVGNFITINT